MDSGLHQGVSNLTGMPYCTSFVQPVPAEVRFDAPVADVCPRVPYIQTPYSLRSQEILGSEIDSWTSTGPARQRHESANRIQELHLGQFEDVDARETEINYSSSAGILRGAGHGRSSISRPGEVPGRLAYGRSDRVPDLHGGPPRLSTRMDTQPRHVRSIIRSPKSRVMITGMLSTNFPGLLI